VSLIPAARDRFHPIGDREGLDAAVKAFAPFGRERSEAHTLKLLHDLARRFLSHRAAERASPRRRQVREDLQRMAALAGTLAGLLENLDDVGREALRQVLGPAIWVERRPGGMIEVREGDHLVPKWFADDTPVPYFERADLAGPRDRLHAWDGVPLWRRLRALAGLARQARGLVPRDRGGNTNTFTEQRGTAKGQLCYDLGELLLKRAEALGEPAELSGGTAGPLYRAAAAIYAYATGEDAEEAALERPVKTAAALLTQREDLQARYLKLAPSGSPVEAVNGILEKLTAVSKQLEEL
jgi:hypothetical protein